MTTNVLRKAATLLLQGNVRWDANRSFAVVNSSGVRYVVNRLRSTDGNEMLRCSCAWQVANPDRDPECSHGTAAAYSLRQLLAR